MGLFITKSGFNVLNINIGPISKINKRIKKQNPKIIFQFFYIGI